MSNIVIEGSIFTHKTIHKTTWVSPDHLTGNQVDHICIGKRFSRSLEDARVKRGAGLLIARLKLKLQTKWMVTATNRRTYNVGLLRDTQKRKEYKLNFAKMASVTRAA